MSLTGMRKTVACVLAMGAVAAIAGGCAGDKSVVVTGDDFQQKVLEARGPVLVDFYKRGCPPCITMDSIFDTLSDEYKGKATIAKIEILNPVFISPAPKIKEKYEIVLTPTVILFNDGKEIKRWISNFSTDDYRKAIDATLRGNAATAASVPK